jgi:hypothetical protein
MFIHLPLHLELLGSLLRELRSSDDRENARNRLSRAHRGQILEKQQLYRSILPSPSLPVATADHSLSTCRLMTPS